jgi:hypothetical protein
MCDYSLENVMSRPAKIGDKLKVAVFPASTTRGFAAVEEPNVAVCLLPGTEVAFEQPVEFDGWLSFLPFLPNRTTGATLARFRQIECEIPGHRDALEFPGGKIVLLTKLVKGQAAKVIQLPTMARSIEQDLQALDLCVP